MTRPKRTQWRCARGNPLGMLAVACAMSGCGSHTTPSAAATAHPTPATATTPHESPGTTEPAPATEALGRPAADCEALVLAWRREMIGEDGQPDPELTAELEERARKFPCELRLDLDGDDVADTVFVTSAGPERSVGIGIVWSDGHASVLGAGNPVVLQPGTEEEGDAFEVTEFGWMMAWNRAPLRDGRFEVPVLHKPVRFDAPGALGDGIEISGSDAAAVIYFDGAEWRWIDLGF